MDIIKLPVGLYQANCYIVRKGRDVLIIDPGSKADRILTKLNSDDHVLAVLLTHGHFDHIGAVDEIIKAVNCPLYCHPSEVELLLDPEKNYSLTKKIRVISSSKSILDLNTLGSFDILVHETPGHTQGSVILQIEDHLFTGDTLFRLGEGRTDLYSGNPQSMKKTLQAIRLWDSHLVVHPGHDEDTVLAVEFKESPSFNR